MANKAKAVFVEEPSPHLLCPVCKKLFQEPVISVKCGHTFCKSCLLTNAEGLATLSECPVDGKSLLNTNTVPNRSIESQIDALLIFCKCGIKRLNSRNDVIDVDGGCPEVVQFGSQEQHDETCGYVQVECPNSFVCGRFQRKNLESHLRECQNYHCQYEEQGCSFRGTTEAVEEHSVSCSCQPSSGNLSVAVVELQKENTELKMQVEVLNAKLALLEQSHDNLLSHMKKIEFQMQSMQEKFADNGTKHSDGQVSRSSSVKVPAHRRNNSTGSASGIRTSWSPEQTIYVSPSDRWQIPFEFKCIGTLTGHSSVINCLAIHGHYVYSSGVDCHIKVWDIEQLSKGCVHTMQGHTAAVQVLLASSDYLFSAGDDKTIRMWKYDATSTEYKCRKDAHTKPVCALAKAGGYLFSSSHSSIKVWAADSLDPVHSIVGLHHWVRALAMDVNKERLYSGSHNSLSVWDTRPPFALKRKLDHSFGSIYSMAITDQFIIIGTYSRNVQIFDVETHEHLKALAGQIGVIQCMVTSPSGRFLITGSYDNTVMIFNLENFLSLQVLSRHQGSVNAIVLRNGLLFTGSEDKDIKIFKYFRSITYSSYGIHITPGKDT